jgi:GxxExxY protein
VSRDRTRAAWDPVPHSQSEHKLNYKSRTLNKTYQPDLDCYGKIIVEIKAVSELSDEYRAQVHNDLKATGYRPGLLVNFGAHDRLQYERIGR